MRAVLLAALLLLPLVPPPASACATYAEVPCGYIYPRLTIRMEAPEEPPALDGALEFEATLVFEFDPLAEGVALDDAANPIVATFEFPRKPAWASIAVEPERVPIPIQPQYLRPDPADPQNPRATYRYEAPLTIRIEATERAVLPDGVDVARLLVFAKSSESGLYKQGYGIREIKVAPVDPLHASDVASAAELAPADLDPFPARDLEVPLRPGLAARLDLPESIELWRPTRIVATLDGAEAPLLVALLDENGHVHAQAGPGPSPLAFNLTFPRPGAWRLLVVAEPPVGAAGSATVEIADPPAGGGWKMPRDYRLAHEVAFDRVAGNAADPAAQDERFVPFAVFEGATGLELAVDLRTEGLPLDRGAANANVAILDPRGAVLQTGTVDALNPSKRFPVGALPGPGLYRVRVFGVGADAAVVALALQVSYDPRPLLRADANPWTDEPGRLGLHNATLDLGDAAPFVPVEARLLVTRADGGAAAGVADATVFLLRDGRVVATTSALARALDEVSVRLTFPAPGAYDVVAVARSAALSDTLAPGSETQWGRGVVARRVVVADGPTSLAHPATFEASSEGPVGPGERETFLVALPAFASGGPIEVALEGPPRAAWRLVLSDAEWNEVASADLDGSGRVAFDPVPPGEYVLQAFGTDLVGGVGRGVVALAYPAPFEVPNPLAAPLAPAEAGLFAPAPAWAILVAATAAVGLARRRS